MSLSATAASINIPEKLARCVIIGHSHSVAIQSALKHRGVTAGPQFLNLHEPQWAAALTDSGSGVLSDLLVGAPAIFSCIGGNGHNVIGLLDHPRPFDFVLEDEPDLTLMPDRELVPAAIVRDVIQQFIRPRLGELARVRECAPTAALFHLESPPPVPSEEHIARYPGIFRTQLETNSRVAPRLLRYKLWRTHCKLFQEACAEHDVTLIPVPAETRDEEGFLAAPYWNPDPTHGNAAYGERVLRQIFAVLEDPT